ncbi:hypothetical protein PSNTI_14350 [Stutzerimonas stutzeri]|nr:conserved hypothetical protein [Stutzerimonas stutzeri DSM 4166]GBC55975.1 hypothetical protein PSNTI_14350 [Stutzerimonas stutzeri]
MPGAVPASIRLMNAPGKPLANGADRPVPGRQYDGNMGAVQVGDCPPPMKKGSPRAALSLAG